MVLNPIPVSEQRSNQDIPHPHPSEHRPPAFLPHEPI